MTTERKQMTGWEYCDRLRQGAREENWRGADGLGVGGSALHAGCLVTVGDDSTRTFKWRNYERLLYRLYGHGFTTDAEDGARRPWSPERLKTGA